MTCAVVEVLTYASGAAGTAVALLRRLSHHGAREQRERQHKRGAERPRASHGCVLRYTRARRCRAGLGRRRGAAHGAAGSSAPRPPVSHVVGGSVCTRRPAVGANVSRVARATTRLVLANHNRRGAERLRWVLRAWTWPAAAVRCVGGSARCDRLGVAGVVRSRCSQPREFQGSSATARPINHERGARARP